MRQDSTQAPQPSLQTADQFAPHIQTWSATGNTPTALADEAGERGNLSLVEVTYGLTKRVHASAFEHELLLAIHPETDLDGLFGAYDVERRTMVQLEGWLWHFEDVELELAA